MKPKGNVVIPASILATLSGVIFTIIIIQKQPDLEYHILLSLRLINGDLHYANFLYYLIVALFAFFQPNIFFLQVSAILVLTASVLFKFFLTVSYLRNLSEKADQSVLNNISWFALLLCIASNFPVNISATWYLGQFPPNLWHNSTTIFLMPFALLLFFDALKYLKQPSGSLIFKMSVWVVIGALIKPSFLFPFLPVFFLLLFSSFRFASNFWKGLIPLFFGALGIAWVGIYNFITNTYNEGGGVEIAPFKVWSNWSEFIPFSMLVSLLFPLALSILLWKDIKDKLSFRFSWFLMIVSIMVYSLFAEKGSNWIVVASNFSWQLIVSNFILFLVCLKETLAINPKKLIFGFTVKKLLLLIFYAHATMGLLYLIKIPIFGYR